jgi:hypothetical protein
MSDTVALIMGTSPVWAGLVAYILTELRPVLWFMLKLKRYCKNYYIVLEDKHNKFLADHPDISGWETNDKETMVWVRSEAASVPSSLFGLPTTIILELASKEPYRGSGKEVVLKRNKHYFFQEMWYGFMDRMTRHDSFILKENRWHIWFTSYQRRIKRK